jgi:tRNA dimethylallyltransferase
VDPGDGLHARIERRLGEMLDAGWLREIRALVPRVPADAPAWNACGYQALRAFAAGQGTLEAARAAILVATRQYAKRQRTWFRHQLGDEAVTPIDPRSAGAVEAAARWWHEERPA